jgi:amino acid transporter
VFIYLYNHTEVAKYTLAVTLCSVVTYTFTMAAAIAFPYRAPDLFNTSPAAKYKLFGVPAIVLFGIVGLIFNIALIYAYLTKDELFVNDKGSLLMVGGIYLATVIFFFARRVWLRRHDYDPDIAFSRIPPE